MKRLPRHLRPSKAVLPPAVSRAVLLVAARLAVLPEAVVPPKRVAHKVPTTTSNKRALMGSSLSWLRRSFKAPVKARAASLVAVSRAVSNPAVPVPLAVPAVFQAAVDRVPVVPVVLVDPAGPADSPVDLAGQGAILKRHPSKVSCTRKLHSMLSRASSLSRARVFSCSPL